MGKWGYVLLAYGIVWSALAGYFFCLRSRFRKAAAKLARLKTTEGKHAH